MRTLLAISIVAGLAWSAPAFALETPKPGVADPRVSTIDYDPQQVVRLVGVFRTATQILLGPGESVLHAALGDATAWDVVVERNIVFIKPKAPTEPTNLIVTTTTAHGEIRNYTFELSTRDGPSARETPDTFFVVRFRYPSDERASAVAALSAAQAGLRQRMVDLKLELGALEGPRNLAYEVQGSQSLQPSEVSDNGRFTLMRFPAGQAIPAIYAVTPQGGESLIPFDVRGEFVVVHGTSQLFRLRRGQDLLCIYNLGPDPDGVRRIAGRSANTAAPDVARTELRDRNGPKP